MSTLCRYTSIPAMLDTLLNRQLAMTDPKAWDDQNDREVMEAFARLHPGKRVFAACMAEGKETAHHWQVFADNGQGACIRFDRERLTAATDLPNVRQGSVSYVEWRELSVGGGKDRLPFIKRGVFRFEREYRLIALVDKGSAPLHAFGLPIPLDVITSVYISGKLPTPLFETIASLIRGIPGCARLRVRHSGLLRNPNWSRSIAGLLSDQSSG